MFAFDRAGEGRGDDQQKFRLPICCCCSRSRRRGKFITFLNQGLAGARPPFRSPRYFASSVVSVAHLAGLTLACPPRSPRLSALCSLTHDVVVADSLI